LIPPPPIPVAADMPSRNAHSSTGFFGVRARIYGMFAAEINIDDTRI
jgi:hypothetical protein